MRVLVVANFYMSYNRRILHGVAAYARLHRWELMQVDVNHANELVRAQTRADAILIGVHRFEGLPRYVNRSLPAVGWSAAVEKVTWPRVLTDNLAVGKKVAEYFLSLGHRRFAFAPNYPGIWARDRFIGFRQRLSEAGYEVELAAPLTAETVRRATAWIRRLPTPTALMLSHDPAAEKIMLACAKVGRRVPEDLAVVGVGDDDLVCEITNPPMSSVGHQNEMIGYESAALLHQIAQGRTDAPEFTLIPPGELVIRRSSDTMAFDDPMVADAMRFIRQHESDAIGTKQVIDHVHTSRVTLDNRFLRAVGCTVAAFIRNRRLEKVKQLLSTSDLPMPTIAKHAGFSNARQLSKTFHHFAGQTPTEYRLQFKLGVGKGTSAPVAD